MAIAFGSNKGNFGATTNGATVAGSPTAQINAGESLILTITRAFAGETITGISDNSTQAGAANVYTVDVVANDATVGQAVYIVKCEVSRNILATDTITITFAHTSTAGRRCGMMTFAGGPLTLDQSSSAFSAGSTSYDSGSAGAATANGVLVIGAANINAGGAVTPGTDGQGNTMIEVHDINTGTSSQLHDEYFIETGGSGTAFKATSSTGTPFTSAAWQAAVAVYKVASGDITIAAPAANLTLSAAAPTVAEAAQAPAGLLTLSAAAPTVTIGGSGPMTVAPPAALLTLSAAPPTLIVPSPTRKVERASYTLEIAWNAYNVGIFTFDVSTFDGTDTFGISPFDVRFTGPNDNMSALFDAASVSRGIDTNREQMNAGTATITLRDPTGMCNPENPSSPLYGQIEDRLHPVRLRAKYNGVTYGVFYGWIRRSQWSPTARRGVATLECVDLFWWLERAQPVIASTGITTTGAAIGKLLDAIGWNDPTARSLDAGDTIPDFSADGTKTALQIIQALLESERGTFYFDGDGIATYRNRLARSASSSVATIINTMRAIAPGVDFEDIINRVTVKRTQNAYTASAVDDTSRRKVGYSDLDIETAYLQSNTNADDLASYLVSELKKPRKPVYELTIDNRDPILLTQILARELVDRITVFASRGGLAGDFLIDQINEEITQKSHTAKWMLTRAGTGTAIRFDTSTFDGADVFVF